MSESTSCRRCGAPIHPSSPVAGVCERCLMRAGLEDDASGLEGSDLRTGPHETASDASGRGPWRAAPPVEQLAPAFPQLEILEPIGRGGMGIVYRARHRRLDRAVALKILPAELAEDAAFTARFEREARALARLDHPNVVSVFDAGRAGPLHYLIMELVEGINLRRLMEAGPLTPREALSIVPQICDALQYAHDQGVVHRDIKPENVLVDRAGRIKITDFGLAKMFETPGQVGVTASRLVMGTPHYMAPEQIERPRDVDHRADLYSLGVVFYEMLTGELPIGRFEPPSRQARVDGRLDSIVLRALAKSPDDRYQQASEIRDDVSGVPGAPAADPHRQEQAARGGVPSAPRDAVSSGASDLPDAGARRPMAAGPDSAAAGRDAADQIADLSTTGAASRGASGRGNQGVAPSDARRGERTRDAGITSKDPASWNGVLDTRAALTWLGLSLLASVLLAALWNLGTWGLLAGSATAAGLYLIGLDRTRRAIPSLSAGRLRHGTARRPVPDAIAALTLGTVPLLLTAALYRLAEARWIGPDRPLSHRALVPEAWSDAAWKVGLELRPGAVEIESRLFGEGSLGVDPVVPALILLTLALGLLFAACCHVFERHGRQPLWRSLLKPGLQVWLAAVAAWMLVLIVPGQASGLGLGWTDAGLPVPSWSQTYVRVPPVRLELESEPERVRLRLMRWMEARGYERHDWVEGRLVTSESPPRRARMLQAYIKPSSAFDRWRFGLRGPVQARPWIVLELVGRGRAERDSRRGVTEPLTIVNASTYMASQMKGESELWAAELQDLSQALSGEVKGGGP